MAPVAPQVGGGETSGATDVFELVSSFYGPGAVGCWYLVIISIMVSGFSNARFGPAAAFKVTNDFVCAVVYVAVAAGDVLLKFATCPFDRQELVNLIYRFEPYGAEEKAEWAVRNGGIDVEKVQLAWAVGAPLRICAFYLFCAGAFALVAPVRRVRESMASMLMIGVAAWVLAVVIYAVAASGNWCLLVTLLGFLFTQYAAACSSMLVLTSAVAGVYMLCFCITQFPHQAAQRAASSGSLKRSLKTLWADRREWGQWLFAGYTAVAGLTTAALFTLISNEKGGLTLWSFCNPMGLLLFLRWGFIPETGVSVMEVDQATGIAYGLSTLGFAIWHARQNRKPI